MILMGLSMKLGAGGAGLWACFGGIETVGLFVASSKKDLQFAVVHSEAMTSFERSALDPNRYGCIFVD